MKGGSSRLKRLRLEAGLPTSNGLIKKKKSLQYTQPLEFKLIPDVVDNQE